MEEQRRYPRKSLFYHLKVLDPKTKHQIGHLSNLSENGCQMVIDHPIKENVNLRLTIENVLSMEGGKTMAFAARCKWCRPQKESSQSSYDAGVEFRHLPAKVKQFVQDYC